MMMRRTLLTLAVLFAALLAVAQKPLYKDWQACGRFDAAYDS